MSELHKKSQNAQQRSKRTRSNLRGTTQRPRLSVNISNSHISAQIINDDEGKTLVYSTTSGRNLKTSMSEQAEFIGADIAKKAKAKKITKVVFDRGNKQYHGRVKLLAESARNEGLEF
jgi:large subunit ribosomal protein L18